MVICWNVLGLHISSYSHVNNCSLQIQQEKMFMLCGSGKQCHMVVGSQKKKCLERRLCGMFGQLKPQVTSCNLPAANIGFFQPVLSFLNSDWETGSVLRWLLMCGQWALHAILELIGGGFTGKWATAWFRSFEHKWNEMEAWWLFCFQTCCSSRLHSTIVVAQSSLTELR